MTTHSSAARRLMIIVTIAAIQSATAAPVASDSKVGIALYAETSNEIPGKTRVKCRIVNESSHLLLWGALEYDNDGYQFKLYDGDGNVLPQIEEWAERHAQEGTANFTHPRGDC
ncbi:MAG: hypothetical protein K9N23_17310 [Akkermansiaceae bacterium]|nr:hypothetical protein [Akkermansiaceae bacterium]MCF7733452.1 hypothetical protein [Akkermansiaceae bacterium]